MVNNFNYSKMFPTIIKINEQYNIKIDLGSEYYIGIVDPESFPLQIRNNYYDILQKSITNFRLDYYQIETNETEPTIISYLLNPTYEYNNVFVINFKFTNVFINMNENINIYLIKNIKDSEDYINERFEACNLKIKNLESTSKILVDKLESEIEELKKNLQKLMIHIEYDDI